VLLQVRDMAAKLPKEVTNSISMKQVLIRRASS